MRVLLALAFLMLISMCSGQDSVKLPQRHCAKEQLETAGRYSTLDAAMVACKELDSCGGVYDFKCKNKGAYRLCKAGFKAERSRSSCVYRITEATDDPRPQPNKPSGKDCMEPGTCTNTVQKCGHCMFDSQCEGDMYCCPYMKKCVVDGKTPCFSPVATCIPPCFETEANYPGNCKCKNKKFPNLWMSTPSSGGPKIEAKLAETNPELFATGDEFKVGSGNVQYVRHEHESQRFVKYFILFTFGIFFAGAIKVAQEKFCVHRGDKYESLVEEI